MLCFKPKTKNIMKELIEIQKRLNAPKNQFNRFGNYHYRSCEDILSALKPLLTEYKCSITLTDRIDYIGTRYYIVAMAKLTNESGESESVTAYAREEEPKKGMDAAQVTGACSSYARKYALNGLFAIDDTKDPDTMDNRSDNQTKPANGAFTLEIKKRIEQTLTIDALKALWGEFPHLQKNQEFTAAFTARKDVIMANNKS